MVRQFLGVKLSLGKPTLTSGIGDSDWAVKQKHIVNTVCGESKDYYT